MSRRAWALWAVALVAATGWVWAEWGLGAAAVYLAFALAVATVAVVWQRRQDAKRSE